MLVVFAGLPGTGKSTLAEALAPHLHAVVLNKDPIRAALFPPEVIEYSSRQDDFVIALILQTAGYLFGKDPGRVVFLDGRPFVRRSQLEQVTAFCGTAGYPLRVIECICASETALERLRRAVDEGSHPAGNRDAGLYARLRAEAEPIDLPHLVVDTDQPLDACLHACLDYLVV